MLKRHCAAFKSADATASQLSILSLVDPSLPATITTTEARSAIKTHFQTAKLGPIQKMNLLTSVTYEELQQILKRKVEFIDDITVADYQRVMSVKGKGGDLFLKTINHPLVIKSEYEYGWQESSMCANGRFYYILSYNIMMIDLDDLPSGEQSTLGAIEVITIKQDLSCRVYKTFNGYHVFITSTRIDHRSELVEKINTAYGGDIYYRLFSERVGFKTRLNKKLGRDDMVATYVGAYGNEKEDDSILDYLKIHDTLVEHHSHSEEPYDESRGRRMERTMNQSRRKSTGEKRAV